MGRKSSGRAKHKAPGPPSETTTKKKLVIPQAELPPDLPKSASAAGGATDASAKDVYTYGPDDEDYTTESDYSASEDGESVSAYFTTPGPEGAYNLFELIASAIHGHPPPTATMWFRPVRDDAAKPNAEMEELIRLVERCRVDEEFRRSREQMAEMVLELQRQTVPSKTVEQAYELSDRVLKKAEQLEDNLNWLRARLRSEKLH